MAKSDLDVNVPQNPTEPEVGPVCNTPEPGTPEASGEPEPDKSAVPPPAPGPDPFDLSKYRINPAEAQGVRKMRLTVPCGSLTRRSGFGCPRTRFTAWTCR
jgi:hypothetical protein